ncbi:hypothetical protein DRJ19_01065 [Candidatus Woesearchaeota archaeon]|nr:MAG: hypothetical protein DRJ19_01065 [Candidatus Woesearchaeota archaeon]
MEEKEKEVSQSSEEKLPLPKTTVTNLLRKHLKKGKQIKDAVKVELNLWLAKMIERIAKKIDEYPYTYVDLHMFREAIMPYEQINEIEKEKERIIKELESIKALCDTLISEIDRKFTLRRKFAYEYLKETEKKD